MRLGGKAGEGAVQSGGGGDLRCGWCPREEETRFKYLSIAGPRLIVPPDLGSTRPVHPPSLPLPPPFQSGSILVPCPPDIPFYALARMSVGNPDNHHNRLSFVLVTTAQLLRRTRHGSSLPDVQHVVIALTLQLLARASTCNSCRQSSRGILPLLL